MDIYQAAPGNMVDPRRVSLRIGDNESDIVSEFDESFMITGKIKKNILEVQNTCTIQIANLAPERRNKLLGALTSWSSRNRAQPFIPIDLRIGRASKPADFTTVFRGSIYESGMSDPPDVIVDLKCMTSLIDQNIASTNFLTKVLPKLSSHRALCQWAADLANIPLRYEVTISLPPTDARVAAGVIQKAYSISAVVGMLANFYRDKVAVFVEDGELVVVEWGKALRGELVRVDATKWLIGSPRITQWGVCFKTLADAPIRVAGGVDLFSELNPAVNQKWVVTGVEYDISSRDTNWYATWTASPSAS